MPPTEPRLAPLAEADWDPEIRETLAKMQDPLSGRVMNVFRTLAHHPKALKRWLVFAVHVLSKSTLSGRDREIAILRIGWRCKAEYEWAQHLAVGRRHGMTDEDFERIKLGPDAPGLPANEALLLRATDELHDQARISDETWAGLAHHYGKEQLIDLVLAVGNYTLVSMALNTLRVELDPGYSGFTPADRIALSLDADP
ncbi:MAG: carboxymuconolactone decarboxylase family protein [Gammaproteobacteria bacterium]|nr:carboxymuconolactone decarboxylase family protein [Gammaproteobacteria bacterium]MBI5615658.1 carboxymuconolactone decarboxylase family protein [Gammaproteobacteria bacterium]